MTSLMVLATSAATPVANVVAGAVTDLNITFMFVGAGTLLVVVALFVAIHPVMRKLG